MGSTVKTLVYAAVLAVVIYLLVFSGGEEEQEEALAYDSVEACIAAGERDEAACREAFDEAQALHEEVAPRYGSRADCYTDFGYDRCYRASANGGSFWLPFMVGYMLAPRGGGVFTQPLYRPSSDPNSYYTSSNARLGSVSSTGRTGVSESGAARPSARTRTVSRGGFGARATTRGGSAAS